MLAGPADGMKMWLTGRIQTLNAAIVVVHHLTKGLQDGKLLTDLGAGGGSQSRAADAHLSLRYHAEEGAAVLAGVVRSWPLFAPRCIRWTYPVWESAPDLEPADLRKPARRNAKSKPEAEAATPQVKAYDAERFAAEFLGDDARLKATVIGAAVAAGLSDRAAGILLAQAEATGLVRRERKRGSRRDYWVAQKRGEP